MNTLQPISTAIILLLTTSAFAAESLQERLSTAKPGQTIELPAGEYRGGVTLPAGVSLKGAGYGKTIIDASGTETGIAVTSGKDVTVSDLTVRGATGTNLLVQGVDNVVLKKVRVTGGLLGASLNNATNSRIENSISDSNRYGIVVSGGEANAVVNCTLAANASVGLSLSSGKDTVAFNNCVNDSSTAVYVGEQTSGLILDHNLYLGLNIGKFKSQIARNTLNNWKYVSSQDAHSVSIPVKYENPTQGQFAVTNTLDWALDRSVTSGWGAASLGSKSAPADDIEGKKRPSSPSIGAFETIVTAPRAADGTLTVTTGNGLTSAGVFDPKGKLVAYLFQGLPLRTGTYSFWLPTRSYKSRNIEPGEYEVRVTESKLDWEYLGWIANSSESDVLNSSCAVSPKAVAFDKDGRLISGRGLSEARDCLRGFDGATGKWLWVFQGSAYMHGLTIPADGLLYALRSFNDTARLTRLDSATGNTAPWGKTDYGQFTLKGGKTFNGLTSLGEQLWYTDGTNNLVWIGTTQSPEPTKSVTVKSPKSPAGDTKTNFVWVISDDEKLVAISPEGKVVAETQPVPQPIALAARDGRLAVASKQTGKVHLFDAADPANLKPLNTLGRGDGPDGRILPDRFLFQDGVHEACLALGPNQELAVGEDDARLQVFDRDGKQLWSAFSTGGWAISPSKLTPGRAYAGAFTMMTDSEQKKWWPESFHRALKGWMVGEFEIQGQTFTALLDGKNGISFVKFTPDKVTPAYGIICPLGSKEPWTIREDSNNDHLINDKDAVVENLLDAKGQPIANRRIIGQSHVYVWPNGDLVAGGIDGWLTRWPCAGLDKKGNPIYRVADRVPIPSNKSDLVSPYDSKAQGGGSVAEPAPRPNGGWAGISWSAGSPAVRHTLLPGGSDVVGVDKDGVVDWIHTFGQLPDNPKIGSLDMSDGIYIASLAATYDFFVLNADGLAMPGFSFPDRAHYVGHWVDHPDTVATFTDKLGRVNVLTCDYMFNRNHWFVLSKKEIHDSKIKLQVKPESAKLLAGLPAPTLDVMAGKPATPVVRIPKLKAPLTIDGDLKKWRDTGISPQVICTPEASMGIEGGPKDCSALVRMAYHGSDLYLQILRFDDVIASHQPKSGAYMQDTVEVCVNGIMEGIKFNISQTIDAGPVNQVDGWSLKAMTLDQQHSPLVIKVLDNAETVTERKLIENIFGVDMRDCKVQLFETKIPMDEKTYSTRPEAKFELKSGQKFWLGFLIDDNDQPGTDVQYFLLWPATYGTFSAKETGAIAELE